jgi:antirestriction protein ArdC
MCARAKGVCVVYADRFIPYRERTRAAEAGDEPEAIPFLKRFTVFNADQCENLSSDMAPPPQALKQHENLVLPQAEALIRATGADLRIGGNRAYYVPSEDFIQVPPASSYFEPINWHRTVCHELGHLLAFREGDRDAPNAAKDASTPAPADVPEAA